MGVHGNRGKCAQPCRLPYNLVHNNKIIDKGYLLSTRDLCTLEFLPQLIEAGVDSFKIEGRMKSPVYVATVTRIYRKYIDLAQKFINKEIDSYVIDEDDKKALLQVFNRGGFSTGHLDNTCNKELVFKEKPNNLGIYLGKIIKYNKNKGLVTVKLENPVSIGDSVSFENEKSKYTISELMDKNINIKKGDISQIVTFGRMKGNIKLNDKVYKISDKELFSLATESFNNENKKNLLECTLNIQLNKKVEVTVKSLDFGVLTKFEYDYIPDVAQNVPITRENVIKQFNKTLNTCFEFSKIEINMDEKLFIPTSILNDIRRKTINLIEENIVESFKRKIEVHFNNTIKAQNNNTNEPEKKLLLNVLNLSLDYEKLNNIDSIYIPLKYFMNKKFEDIIKTISKKSKIYIYMPVVIKDKFVKTITNQLIKVFERFDIYGIVVSNLAQIEMIKNLPKVDLIANYTFNVYNLNTVQVLKDMGFSTVTISPELHKDSIRNICSYFDNIELISYGNIPVMNASYCLLGNSNKCFESCSKKCNFSDNLYLKDRLGFKFKVIPDNLQTITTIYNSKTTKLDYSDVNVHTIRIDILDENIEDINFLITRK